MPFSPVYSDDINIWVGLEELVDPLVHIEYAFSLEIHGYGNVELELINGVAFILDDVVFKSACGFWIVRIFIFQTLFCFMYGSVFCGN